MENVISLLSLSKQHYLQYLQLVMLKSNQFRAFASWNTDLVFAPEHVTGNFITMSREQKAPATPKTENNGS